jgi:hypothetical protein
MCVARLNTAHGDFSVRELVSCGKEKPDQFFSFLQYHQSILDNLSSACEIRNTICATMLDIKVRKWTATGDALAGWFLT